MRFEFLRALEQVHDAGDVPACPPGGWDLSLIQRDRDCADALGTLGPDRSEQGRQVPRVLLGGSLGDSAAAD